MTIEANVFDMRTLPSAGKDWHEFLQTDDATDCEEIKAAESGHSHYITELKISHDYFPSMDISVGSGETDGAITTIHFGPIPMKGVAISRRYNWKAPRGKGIKCTSGLSVTIDSTIVATLNVEAHGKTVKD